MRSMLLTLSLLLTTPALAGPATEACLSRARELAQARPDAKSMVDGARARTTRAGFPRFVSPDLRDPDLAPLVVARLQGGKEESAVRAALADLLGRYGETEGAALAEMAREERDPGVRAMLIRALRDVPGGDALPALRAALKDPAPGVRAAAAHEVGHRLDTAALAVDLAPLSRDADALVRQEAVFSLGVLRAPLGRSAVVQATKDRNADVRAAALRAMYRLDPTWLRGAEAAPLLADPDERVARIARRLRNE
jgi:hypothetical protein